MMRSSRPSSPKGLEFLVPAWAHSARIEVKGGWSRTGPYWYRFLAGNEVSPVGRTRTAPAPKDVPARLRLAYASGQQYEQGYFNAYRHMVADDPDLIVFLGDYIYTAPASTDAVRKHTAAEPRIAQRLPVRPRCTRKMPTCAPRIPRCRGS